MKKFILFLFSAIFSTTVFANDTICVTTEAIIKVKLDSIFTIESNDKDTEIKYIDSKININRKFWHDDPVYVRITTPDPNNLVFITKKDYEIISK